MPENKENCSPVKAQNKGRKVLRVSKSNTNAASSINTPTSLNNDLQSYIEYNKQVEQKYKTLQAELESNEIDKTALVDYYEKELAAIRMALTEISTEKNETSYKVNELEDEKNSLQRLYDDQKLQNSLLRQTVYDLESLRKEFDEVHKKNKKYAAELQCARAEIESMQTLCEQADFYKSLSTKAGNLSQNVEEYSNFKLRTTELEDEYENLKEELMYDFQKREQEMKTEYQKKVEEFLTMNEQLQTKMNSKTAELKVAIQKQDNSRSVLLEREAEIAMLKNRVSQDAQLIAKLNIQRETEVREIGDEYEALRLRYQEKVAEVTELVEVKVAMENDLYLSQAHLKKEQSRLHLESPQHKKRKVATRNDKDGQEHIISAWSNGKMKLACDEDFHGNMVWIINDGEEEIDLNEWKLRFVSAIGESVEYVFPSRLLAANRKVSVWSTGLSNEDEDNEVMNVAIPQSGEMRVNLCNDMDEEEAAFELKKTTKKILSARRMVGKGGDQKECILM